MAEAVSAQADHPRAVVYLYTQTGQLREVAEALTGPLAASGWQIRWLEVQPREPFPFPWPVGRFFGVFPRAVDAEASVELTDPEHGFASAPDELVILAYQVWYLAPSLPVRTLLDQHPEAVRDRSVVSLVACRNMWYSATVEVSTLLKTAGAHSVAVVAATDTHRSFTTLVTTLRWLLTGRREPFLWFSRAGVGYDELARVTTVGGFLAQRTRVPADAAPVVPALAAADLLAGWIFRRWGAVVRKARPFGAAAHGGVLAGFVFTLAAGIAVGLPLIALAAALGGPRFAAAMRRYLYRRTSFGALVGLESASA